MSWQMTPGAICIILFIFLHLFLHYIEDVFFFFAWHEIVRKLCYKWKLYDLKRIFVKKKNEIKENYHFFKEGKNTTNKEASKLAIINECKFDECKRSLGIGNNK